jgi:hypothetical protein
MELTFPMISGLDSWNGVDAESQLVFDQSPAYFIGFFF